jgi:hypothetical protein
VAAFRDPPLNLALWNRGLWGVLGGHPQVDRNGAMAECRGRVPTLAA